MQYSVIMGQISPVAGQTDSYCIEDHGLVAQEFGSGIFPPDQYPGALGDLSASAELDHPACQRCTLTIKK